MPASTTVPTRLLTVLLMLILLLGAIPVSAQEIPLPPEPLAPVAPQSAAAPTFPLAIEALGSPGTSFGFQRQYGVSREAYLEDTTHFQVTSVALEGDSLWLADGWGMRVLKFSAAGVFDRQVGKAGYRYGSQTTLDYVTDVALDGSGKLWIVDADTRQATQFAADGTVLLTLGKRYQEGSDNDIL